MRPSFLRNRLFCQSQGILQMLARRKTKVLFKRFGKMADTGIPHGITGLCHICFSLIQKFHCRFKTLVAQIIKGGDAVYYPETIVQLGPAHAHGTGKFGHIGCIFQVTG